ncbi:MAG: hypothetical protein CMG71_02020 [Candidatus Marinimicrobia bacterium]|nr:hypothetical protein [Candidatus Neomarinimicrobiota bacterium]
MKNTYLVSRNPKKGSSFKNLEVAISLVALILNACTDPADTLLTEEQKKDKSFVFPPHMNEVKCNACHGLETRISKIGGLISHNTGQDCIECHSLEGAGSGVYTVAGSIFHVDQETPFPNILVKLFPNKSRTGNPVAVLEVDGLGNFYTTEDILPEGKGDGEVGMLYPSVVTDDNQIDMPIAFSTSMGGCNSCHGVTIPRIFAK